MSRKPGDDIEDSTPLTYNYCWVDRGSALECEHKGANHYVGNFGGASANYKYGQFYVEESEGPAPVKWGDWGDYIMVPRASFETLIGAHTHTVEFLCEDPPYEERPTVFIGDWWCVFGNSEKKYVDGYPYTAIPRHALSRYAVQPWGDEMKFRKVTQTLDDRPCFCISPICYDMDRRARWMRDFGEEADHVHNRNMYELWTLHPMWEPTSKIEVIKYQLSTYLHIFEEEKERQKEEEAMREAA